MRQPVLWIRRVPAIPKQDALCRIGPSTPLGKKAFATKCCKLFGHRDGDEPVGARSPFPTHSAAVFSRDTGSLNG